MLQYQFKVIAQHAVANNLLRNAYIKDIAKFSMLAELLLKSGDLPARSLSDCTAQFLQEWPGPPSDFSPCKSVESKLMVSIPRINFQNWTVSRTLAGVHKTKQCLGSFVFVFVLKRVPSFTAIELTILCSIVKKARRRKTVIRDALHPA